jgi:nitrite reductase/ring-hydroxylating ferredoxin subunit
MEEQKKYTWYKVAQSLEEINFAANGMAIVEINKKSVCVALHNNVLSACSNKCPHAGGHLEEGYLDTLGNIVCPLHRYKFNPGNGRNVSGEGYFLKTYPIKVEEDGIFIGFVENNFFGFTNR